jgi:putative ABC transport system permease protein
LQEASLLRALGASKKQLSQAQWIEYGLLGSLAGLLAATGAAATGWVLAHQVFEFAFQPSPWLWLLGIMAGALCALAGGWLGLRHILNQPPLLSLREG